MIVVTGAASGIGAALVGQLKAAGHDVTGLDIRAGEGVDHTVDLSRPDDIARLAKEIQGPVTGLANVAGLPGTRPIADIYAVNVHAPYQLAHALPLFEGAPIVIVSSVTADRASRDDADAVLRGETPDLPGKTAYEVSKQAANLQMLRLLGEGYHANAVAPGTVDTPILADFEQSIGAEHIARAADATGGHGEPADIASVIAFLLSPAARWIRGQVIKVDGGLHGGRAARELDMAGWVPWS